MRTTRISGRWRRQRPVWGTLAAAVLTLLLPAASSQAAAPKDVTHKDFDPAKFTRPTVIDNRWTPLVPGTQLVLEGQANRGQGVAPHQIIFTVTDVTKVIDGVRTLVVWDRDVNQGQLVEEELTFEAQDDDGNVWNLGEYPEEYEAGVLVGAPNTWIPGQDGAQAGVLMRATPREKTSSYVEGLSPKIGFDDEAKVSKEHQTTCVPTGCYSDVLVIDEWNPLEPKSGHQLKSYVAGLGNVRVDPVGGPEQETLALVQQVQLSPQALADARAAVLRLDRHAYEIAGSVYGATPPATVDSSLLPPVPGGGASAGQGRGHGLAALGGGIVAFGDAASRGSAGATGLGGPVAGMAAS